MDYFSTDGVFWLPDQSARRVPGTLTFDVDGVTLRLHDSLHELPPAEHGVIHASPGWMTVPIIHGHLHDGPDVTLLTSRGISMAIPAEDITESWRSQFALTGQHVEVDCFNLAVIGFDALMAWASPAGVVTEMRRRRTVKVGLTTTTIAKAAVSGDTVVQLLTGIEGKWSDDRIHIDQWCQFECTGNLRSIRRILDEWVRPLQDLLIVCLGRPVRLTSFHVRIPAVGSRTPRPAVLFPAVQPPGAAAPTDADILYYDAPTLVTRRNLPVDPANLVARWFDLRDEQRDAVTLLCAPFYAPFIYGEHRYASTFQAAEALARPLGGKEKTKTEHWRRVEAVTAALAGAEIDSETIAWASRVLRGRNDKSLVTLIKELTALSGDVGRQILETAPTFPNDVVRARVGVSHGQTRRTDPVHRHWLCDALTWIVRIRLLVEAGVPLADLARTATSKPRFARMLAELSAPRGPGVSAL